MYLALGKLRAPLLEPQQPKKLEYGLKVVSARVPDSFGFGIRGRSYSKFLAYTVYGPK